MSNKNRNLVAALLVSLSFSGVVGANTDLLEDSTSGKVFHLSQMDYDKSDEDKKEKTNTWAQAGANFAKGCANKAGDFLYEGAKYAAAYVASDRLGYNGINMAADAVAYVATPVLGPVVPAAAAVIKGANFVSEYIPGVREAKHALIAHATKDYVLPGIASAGSMAYNAGKALYSYMPKVWGA